MSSPFIIGKEDTALANYAVCSSTSSGTDLKRCVIDVAIHP
jgi:hypothetical protein